MECITYTNQIHQLMDEHQKLEDFPNLNTHINHCVECASFYSDLEKLFKKIDEIEFPEPHSQLSNRIFEHIQKEKRSHYNWFYFSLAACLFISISCLYYHFSSKTEQKHSPLKNNVASNSTKQQFQKAEANETLKEEDVLKMSAEFREWIVSLNNSKKTENNAAEQNLFLSVRDYMKNGASNMGGHFSEMLSTERFSSFFSEGKPSLEKEGSEERTLGKVSEDLNSLIHVVKEDLSFLSFGL